MPFQDLCIEELTYIDTLVLFGFQVEAAIDNISTAMADFVGAASAAVQAINGDFPSRFF